MSYASTVLATPGLVSYWRLDEASGTAAADSQGTNGGTYANVTLGTPGLLFGDADTAATFDGTSSTLSIPNAASLNPASWSWEFWINPTAGTLTDTLYHYLTDKSNDPTYSTGYRVSFIGTGPKGDLYLHSFPGSTWWGALQSIGTGIQHVVVTLTGTTVLMYVNGVAQTMSQSGSSFTAPAADTSSVQIGGVAAGFNYGGVFDEVAFYNVVLSQATVTAHYLAGTTAATATSPGLPRRLGPAAVGPTFFAALQPPQPTPAAPLIPVWYAPTRPQYRPAPFAVRSRRVNAFVPAQLAPVTRTLPMPIPRGLYALQRRGQRSFPVQPQRNPPYPWTRRQPAAWRWQSPPRGRRTVPVATPAAAGGPVTFVAAGAVSTVGVAGGDLTPGMYAGVQAGDIIIVIVTAHDTVTCAFPAGYTVKTRVNNAGTVTTTVAWKRAVGSDAAPTVTHSGGDAAIARCIGFRGAVSAGDPFATYANTQDGSGSTTVDYPSITPSVANTMLIAVASDENASGANSWTDPGGTNPVFASASPLDSASGTASVDQQAWYGIHTDLSATGARTSTLGNFAATTTGIVLALKPAPAALIPVWLAPTRPGSRIAPFVVRSVRTRPVPTQDPPLTGTRPQPLRRGVYGLVRRGQRSFPVQPQLNPPYPWAWRQPAGRRWYPPIRGRQTVVPPQPTTVVLVWPPSKLGAPRRLLVHVPRGRQTTPIPPQGAPIARPNQRLSRGLRAAITRRAHPALPQDTPKIAPQVSARLSRGLRAGLHRGKQWLTIPAQIPVPPPIVVPNRQPAGRRLSVAQRGRQWAAATFVVTPIVARPPPRLGAPRRLLAVPTRGRQIMIVLPQVTVPPRSTGNRQPTGRRHVPPARGRQVTPVPPQLNPPYPWLWRQPAGRRYITPGRGRQTMQVQAAFVQPPTPCITPPTKATIWAYTAAATITKYTSAATLNAYSSTSHLNAYHSTASIVAYAASPAIVAYSSHAGIVIYHSSAQIGPTLCP